MVSLACAGAGVDRCAAGCASRCLAGLPVVQTGGCWIEHEGVTAAIRATRHQTDLAVLRPALGWRAGSDCAVHGSRGLGDRCGADGISRRTGQLHRLARASTLGAIDARAAGRGASTYPDFAPP